MAIRESVLNTINTIATSDFVRSVTSAGASSKVTVSNLAKAIIENYTGSSLGGSTRSVKSAVDAINTTMNASVFKAGDTLTNAVVHTASYLTTGKTAINLTVPFPKAVVASSFTPTKVELITRQNGTYTHGSGASTYVEWTVSSAYIDSQLKSLVLQISHTADDSAINNAPIGIAARITGSFS